MDRTHDGLPRLGKPGGGASRLLAPARVGGTKRMPGGDWQDAANPRRLVRRLRHPMRGAMTREGEGGQELAAAAQEISRGGFESLGRLVP